MLSTSSGTVVAPGDVTTTLAVGVDIGGTKIAVGLVDESGTVHAQRSAPTPANRTQAIERTIASLVEDLRRDTAIPIVALGAAAAGFVQADHSTVSFAPNLAWREHDLGAALTALTGLPTTVENDANAAGWGEARFGSGAGVADLLVLTLGTGLGGAIVSRSELLRGAQGMAAEVGHLRLVPDGEPCGCGQHGCWEQYVSGTSLTRQARRAAAADPAAAARLLDLAGGTASGVRGVHVTWAAREGDPLALRLWSELGAWVGAGVAGMCAVLDPQVVVIAGGLATEADLFLPAARAELARLLPGGGHRTPPRLQAAGLGNDAGLVGAADLARLRIAAS